MTNKTVTPGPDGYLFNPSEFGSTVDEMIKKGWRLSAYGNRLVYAPDYPGTRLPRSKKRKRRAKPKECLDLFSTPDDDLT